MSEDLHVFKWERNSVSSTWFKAWLIKKWTTGLLRIKKTRGGTPYDGLYGETPPERGTFFRLRVYDRVGISLVEIYKRVGKFVIWVCERAQKG